MAINGHNIAEHVAIQLTYVTAYPKCMLQEILPGFNHLEGRANTIADEDEAEAFFNTMEDLRQATINLYTTGIYHLLEQQLMDVPGSDVLRPQTSRTERYRPQDRCGLVQEPSRYQPAPTSCMAQNPGTGMRGEYSEARRRPVGDKTAEDSAGSL